MGRATTQSLRMSDCKEGHTFLVSCWSFPGWKTLLTYLFRLCFNQCNASLHLGSSKHSAYFQNPPSHSLLLTLWSFLLLGRSDNQIVVSSRCCFPNVYVMTISHLSQEWYTISLVVLCLPPAALALLHPLVCIRFPAFTRDLPAVPIAMHPSIRP